MSHATIAQNHQTAHVLGPWTGFRNKCAACLSAVMMVWGLPRPMPAQDAAAQGVATDLSAGSFFSTGWDEPWTKRSRGEGTPDMSLLRVQTNFLVQLLRIDTFLETGMTSPGADRSEFVNSTIEYALNRRFMPGIFYSHQWVQGSDGAPDKDGAAGGLFARFQLAEHQQSTLAFTVKAALPDTNLGEHATVCSYAFAGWEDLQRLGLGRTGLYWSLQHEIAAGPVAPGAARNDAAYVVSLARSWTGPHAALENLTTFLETAGRTLLDGDHGGRTIVTLTPGFRFTLGGRQILMAGADLPVAGPRGFDTIYRLTYIFNF